MAKTHTSYICNQCKHTSIKWAGCCPSCAEWDTFTELAATASRTSAGRPKHAAQPGNIAPLATVTVENKPRMLSGIDEWDRVVGGGIMPNSFIMLTGDPGIGKSTLLLQVSNQLAYHHRVFYFSTEESLGQVKLRAERIGPIADNLYTSDQTDLEEIIATAQQEKPDILIIDSIQNCHMPSLQSAPGSVVQLRESTFALMRLAKGEGITVVVTGHITKEGTMAGPKTVEHMVDAVLYLQGEDRWHSRVLRGVKNRFGTVNEIGFFEMEQNGLREITNINEHLLSEASHSPGSALICTVEGSRPLLLELQALTIESKLAMPQRVVSGIDHKHVVLIAAILQKYLQVKLSTHDIFFKVSGGFKIKSSVVDLGIALALLSSYFQQPLPKQSIALGEISLTGQIKPINQISMLMPEIKKFGIQQLFLAKNQTTAGLPCSAQRFHSVYQLLTLFDL